MELLQLIRECKEGRITAQKYLYDRFATQFFLVCRRYLRTDAEAEEILQNGFVKVFDHLSRFSYVSDAGFVAWMKKIMVNECLQELRRKNSFLLVAEDLAAEVNVEDDVYAKLSAREIYRLITQLPIGYRTVFNLHVIEGFSHAEIATQLGISEGTSKSQLNKAKKTLQHAVTKNNLYAERQAK